MNTKHFLVCSLAASLAPHIAAQAPQLAMTPALAPTLSGAVVGDTLHGPQGSLFAVFADLQGGPVDVLGERVYLSLSPFFTTLHAGVMPAQGQASSSFTIPLLPGLVGLVVFAQGIVIDPTAPNGLFRTSNGASTAIHSGPGAIVAAFDDPVAVASFTGTFANDVAGHLRGGPVTRRTHRTIDPQSVPFGGPIATPLVPFGCRAQMVYRTQDLGATGEPELITSVRWMPHPSIGLAHDAHTLFELRAAHTAVVPNYAVDPFSALPVAPNSGLSTTFANNVLTPLQLMYAGTYIVDSANLLPSGYLPYPVAAPFRYDGVSSLLLEFRVGPNTAGGLNGGLVRLMVQSSPSPNGRVHAAGSASSFLIPSQATIATGGFAPSGTPTIPGDNAMHDLELEFARTETFAQSPWLDSLAANPDYGAPVVAQSLPFGTSVQVEYRGSNSASGASPTAWSASPDVADGRQFLQFRIVFHANLLTGERPLVDTVVVPLL
ncbi:MAG TPA: hypothetical protein VF384_11880 [Planctomycetota bacterium]